jgi:hypothetical protein
MSKVIKIIATNENDKNFEAQLVNDEWHGFIEFPEMRTICGIQLQGDDGYAGSDEADGNITCGICTGIIEAIKVKYYLPRNRPFVLSD